VNVAIFLLVHLFSFLGSPFFSTFWFQRSLCTDFDFVLALFVGTHVGVGSDTGRRSLTSHCLPNVLVAFEVGKKKEEALLRFMCFDATPTPGV
jgi:hypothetical protein